MEDGKYKSSVGHFPDPSGIAAVECFSPGDGEHDLLQVEKNPKKKDLLDQQFDVDIQHRGFESLGLQEKDLVDLASHALEYVKGPYGKSDPKDNEKDDGYPVNPIFFPFFPFFHLFLPSLIAYII